jgi:hypothetical protein
MTSVVKLRCHPLTRGRWNDFEQLFGKNEVVRRSPTRPIMRYDCQVIRKRTAASPAKRRSTRP